MIAVSLALLLAASPELERGRQLVHELHEEEALAVLSRAKVKAAQTPDELAEVHLYLGLAHAGLAHKAEAMTAFQTARVLAPDIALPEWVSPRVIEWWVESGGTKPGAPQTPPPAEKIVVVQSPPKVIVERAHPLRWVGGAMLVGAAGLAVSAALVGTHATELSRNAAREGNLDAAIAFDRDAHQTARTANFLYAGAGVLAIGGGVAFAFDVL